MLDLGQYGGSVDFSTSTAAALSWTGPRLTQLNFTICCWVNLKVFVGAGTYIWRVTDLGSNNVQLSLPGFSSTPDVSNAVNSAAFTNALVDNVWTYTAVTSSATNTIGYSGTSSGNVTQQGSVAAASDASSNTICCGNFQATVTDAFNGQIADLIVYSRVLTSREVALQARQRAPLWPGAIGMLLLSDAPSGPRDPLSGTRWSINGTLATGSSRPPVPWRYSPRLSPSILKASASTGPLDPIFYGINA
jgi:hypothetical protein